MLLRSKGASVMVTVRGGVGCYDGEGGSGWVEVGEEREDEEHGEERA